MAEGNEEIYSTMFSSLKHPVRRKILRILADKPLTFSEMLGLLDVSSSNLTYHLENLGELVTKDDAGRYRLSTFGLAAVGTMKIVEEAPPIQPKTRAMLSFKWKTVIGAVLIALVVFASFAVVEYGALNQTASERDSIQAKYNQLLAWSATTDRAITFLENVAQIDTSKYQATLLSRTVESRADLGGAIEEIVTYALTSSNSKLDVVFRFRNNQLSRYQLITLEGSPIYAQAQPHSVLEKAKDLLSRLGAYEDKGYLANMSSLLSLVDNPQNIEIKEGNQKLSATFQDNNAQITITYTQNDVDFSPKSLSLTYENGDLKQVIDGWFLFTVGDTSVKISADRAAELAKTAIDNFSWTAEGKTISGFKVLSEPASVVFHPNTKGGLALYPQWLVTFNLDGVYAGNVDSIMVEVWADSGEIAQITPTS
ncbi:MAG: winged helix-turn-helix domain-containing protein [Candidatus Bathyarchaeota archaeon]|nr:winged helix-turn-helix domain-containing protein [Candidatus Bathyarchaeota archaeon]